MDIENMTFEKTMFQKHHIYWHHDEIHSLKLLEYNIYHLKMLNKVDREKRAILYEKIDPLHKMQSIGYAYLTDETGLMLRRVIPEDLEM